MRFDLSSFQNGLGRNAPHCAAGQFGMAALPAAAGAHNAGLQRCKPVSDTNAHPTQPGSFRLVKGKGAFGRKHDAGMFREILEIITCLKQLSGSCILE